MFHRHGRKREGDVHLNPRYLSSQERQAKMLREEGLQTTARTEAKRTVPLPQQLSPKQSSKRGNQPVQKQGNDRLRAASDDSEGKMEEMLRPSSYYSIFQKIKPSTNFRKKQLAKRASDDSDSSAGGSSITRIMALIKPSAEYRRKVKDPGTPKSGPSSEYMDDIQKRPESGVSIFRPSSTYLEQHKKTKKPTLDDFEEAEMGGKEENEERTRSKPQEPLTPRTRNIYRVLGPRKPRKKKTTEGHASNTSHASNEKRRIRVIKAGLDEASV